MTRWLERGLYTAVLIATVLFLIRDVLAQRPGFALEIQTMFVKLWGF